MTFNSRQISSLVDGYSVEITPAGAARIGSFATHLPAGTTVNVTFLPGSDIAGTVSVCRRLRAEGFNPVPHLAARSLTGRSQLERTLDELVTHAAVTEVLVIAGGVDRPLGPFASSMDLLETGLLERRGIRTVGVAGHPEGSPDIPAPELARALARKNAWARDTGLDVYIETQFCFDADTVAAWERRLRADGNRLPIRVGVPGPATVKTLLRFAQVSGVGPSMLFLTRQARSVTRLLAQQQPDRFVARLAELVAADPGSLVRGLHFYPFGGLAKTAEWVNAVSAGAFRPDGDNGFTVRGQALPAAS